jgi:sodium-dependent dicarboxylate transporter 2/3/5
MTVPIITTLAIIVLMTISFLFEILPLGFTALMVPVLLQGSGILSGKEAWAGFSNSTVITWIGLFIIGGVFAKTSLTNKIKYFVSKHTDGNPTKVMIIILASCTLMGLMTTATATLAAVTPILMEICDETGLDRKRVFKSVADVSTWACVQMLPVGSSLSYLLLFNQYLEGAGASVRYGLLDMTWIKFPMWIVLVAYYLYISRNFTKKRREMAAANENKQTAAKKENQLTPKQEKWAIFIFVANMILMIVASVTKLVPVYLVSTTFASLAVGLRLVSQKEALNSVSWSVIFLVAGTLPLSTAINKSGTGKWIAGLMTQAFPDLTSPVILATVFCIVTMIATQFMSNTAVWAVFAPIAASMAVHMGLDPRLTVSGVACGALICFATPMAATAGGYAYGVCNFNMKEFIKIGWFPCLLLTIVFAIWAPIVLRIIY